jgi:hypothetical protein
MVLHSYFGVTTIWIFSFQEPEMTQPLDGSESSIGDRNCRQDARDYEETLLSVGDLSTLMALSTDYNHLVPL